MVGRLGGRPGLDFLRVESYVRYEGKSTVPVLREKTGERPSSFMRETNVQRGEDKRSSAGKNWKACENPNRGSGDLGSRVSTSREGSATGELGGDVSGKRARPLRGENGGALIRYRKISLTRWKSAITGEEGKSTEKLGREERTRYGGELSYAT